MSTPNLAICSPVVGSNVVKLPGAADVTVAEVDVSFVFAVVPFVAGAVVGSVVTEVNAVMVVPFVGMAVPFVLVSAVVGAIVVFSSAAQE